MAGLYSRFKQAGYTTPKYLLDINEKNILGEILQGLTQKYNFETILLIANKNDYGYKSEILNTLKKFKKQNLKIEFIGNTLGQAETAWMGVTALRKCDPKSKKVVFHNIDTILYDRDFRFIDEILDEYDGYIDIFNASTDKYSYVKCNGNGILDEIKEKIVISNMATSGLYCFSDFGEFEKIYKSASFQGEQYISFIYEKFIENGKKIFIDKNLLGKFYDKKTIILGTPEEYETYIKNKK